MSKPGWLAHYFPRLAASVAVGVGLAVLSVLLVRHLNAYLVQLLVLMGCNVILALSLNLINGWTGQFSIGHAGFMAIGAYATAKITCSYGEAWLQRYTGSHWEVVAISAYMVALMCAGGIIAAVGGLLIGLPSLRLRGDYLAIATLGFGEIIRVILLNIDAVGGARGFTGIPRYSNLFLVLATAVLTTVALRNLVCSAHGRALLAIREDETAAAALGIDCARYKTAAFVIGAFSAATAGCLYAHYMQFIHPRTFDFMKSIELVLMVVLGAGRTGPVVLAAIALTFLPEGLRQVKDVLHLSTDPRMVLYAALLIAAMLARYRRRSPAAASARRAGGAVV